MADTISIPVKQLAEGEYVEMPKVTEEEIRFKRHSDKMVLSINAENGETVAQLTGYNIEVGFNYKYFKEEEDVQAAANAIAELAVKLIMEAMVEKINYTVNKHQE